MGFSCWRAYDIPISAELIFDTDLFNHLHPLTDHCTFWMYFKLISFIALYAAVETLLMLRRQSIFAIAIPTTTCSPILLP